MGLWSDVKYCFNKPNYDASLAMSMERKEVIAGILKNSARASRLNAAFLTDYDAAKSIYAGADALESVSEGVTKVHNFHKKAEAVLGIYHAYGQIDTALIRENPQEAARQFGRIFYNSGVLVEHLPPPLSTYGTFLRSFDGFMVNMTNVLTHNANTPTDRMLRQIGM